MKEHELLERMVGVDDWQTRVWQPNHPLLFRNPDYLLASPGKLIAGFFPTKEELNRHQSLMARISLARMALPTHTFFVLEHADSISEPSLLNAVDAPIREGKREFLQVLRNGTKRIDIATAKLQKHWYQLFHRRMLTSTRISAEANELDVEVNPITKAFSGSHPKRHDGRWMRGIVEGQSSTGQEVAVVTSTNKRKLQALRQICVSSIYYGNDIDNGLLYHRQRHLFAPTPLESAKNFDPNWPIRVMSFAGVLPLPRNDMRLMDIALEEYTRARPR